MKITNQEHLVNKIKKAMSEKVILFSDLHIGKKSNANSYHKICLDYAKWLQEKAHENNIDTLLFLGDFFHDRSEISLTSLHVANLFLNQLKEFNIILIVGNHDCYYKDNAEIHSLSLIKKWDNVIVVDQTTVFDYLDKKFAFLPWGFNYDDIPTGVDYGFGHLAIENFRINKVKLCEKSSHSISASNLLDKIKLVFSGHFHIRSNKKYKNGKITYIGNTFEHDWSDFEDQKGIEIFDVTTGDTTFIPNNVSPKHLKFHLSKIIAKDEDELNSVKTQFKNNYSRLIVDETIDTDKLYAITSKLSNLCPLEFDSEITTKDVKANVDDFESVEIELNLLLTEFIDKLEIIKHKDKILEKSLDIYEESIKEMSAE